MSGEVTITTEHGEPVTVPIDGMQDDPEVRRQMGEVVKSAGPGIAGDASFAPPSEDAFKEAGVEFIESEALEAIAERLIRRHDRFSHLHIMQMTILYGWKREGGQSGGRARLGQCMRPNWLARQYSEADFIIWLAADYLRNWHEAGKLSEREIEAMLYHELCHAGVNDKNEPKIWPHQFEGFLSELEEYPGVLPQWKAVVDVVQERLPGV